MLSLLRALLIVVFVLVALGLFTFGAVVIRASGTEANLPVGLVFLGLGVLTARHGVDFVRKTGPPPPPPYVPPN